VLAAGRARATSFASVAVDTANVRPLSPNQTDYKLHRRAAVAAAGGRAFVTEFAGIVAAPPGSLASLLAARPFVTRLATSIAPREMTRDPIFVIDARDQAAVNNLYTVDITGDEASLNRLGVMSPSAP